MTLCVKRGSAIDGIAISNCPVRKPAAFGVDETVSSGRDLPGATPAGATRGFPATGAGPGDGRLAAVSNGLRGLRVIPEIWGDASRGASVQAPSAGVTLPTRSGRSIVCGIP